MNIKHDKQKGRKFTPDLKKRIYPNMLFVTDRRILYFQPRGLIRGALGMQDYVDYPYDGLRNIAIKKGTFRSTLLITRARAVNGFYRSEVAMFRGEKQAYYGHFSEHTFNLIKQVKEKLERNPTSSYLRKWKFVAPKYLRKYAFDKMIELEVPESVADFIEGRVAKRIGAKHYLALARQSSKFYPRYSAYVEGLRTQA